MDYIYSTVSNTPVKQIDSFTTPVKKLRGPLIRTFSSPALHVPPPQQPDFCTPMSRRDSTSSFASSIDSWPMTPVSEEFVTPDMLYRSTSQYGGRPRSSTAGSMSSSCHPYYPTPSTAARMQRRHTHMGGHEGAPKIYWPAMPSYSSFEAIPMEYPMTPHTPSQSAAYSAIQSATSTPMQDQLSSPLSELDLSYINRMAPSRDALPLIVSSMDKAHVCPHCKKRFRRLEHVKRHERSHTLEKPFACSIEGCGRFFSRSDNLKAHEKTHSKKGRNYRLMQKKKSSPEAYEAANADNHSQGSPSDEGLGASEEYEHDPEFAGELQNDGTESYSSEQYLAYHEDGSEESKAYNYDVNTLQQFTQ